MRKIKVLILFSLIVAGLGIFFVFRNLRSGSAIESVGLSISPPTFEISANPGDTLENTIRVENLTTETVRIFADRRNFTAVGEEGEVNLTTEDSTTFSLASWISVEPPEAEVPAKTQKVFTFKTRIPLNAEPGGHFGSIVFRMAPQTVVSQTGATLTQELGALILLRVAGKTTERATIESFVPAKKFWERGPVVFDYRIKNEGNLHIKPIGTVTVNNLFGKKVAVINVEPKNVLPGAIRKNSVSWDQKLLLGGKYTAFLSLTYGSESTMMVSSTSFYGFPFKIGGAVLLVLIILAFLAFKARKRIKLALRILLSGK